MLLRILSVLVALSLVTCGGRYHPLEEPVRPLTRPLRLCGLGQPTECRKVEDFERWLSEPDVQVLDADPPPGGDQGTQLLTARTRRGEIFRAKWRGPGTSNMLNEPRKELAAYAVQSLFSTPREYVVPPTAVRCFALDEYRRWSRTADEPLEGTDCVLGYWALWLEQTVSVGSAREEGLLADGEGIFSPGSFRGDVTYRESLGRANLFMFAINHGDPHQAQFVLQPTQEGTRVFVVDNSVAFRSVKTPLLPFLEDWSDVRVPSLPPHVLERMRRLDDRDFAKLGTIVEFELREGRLERLARPSGRVSVTGQDWDGSHLVIGLTPGEIELVRGRIAELLERFPSPR